MAKKKYSASRLNTFENCTLRYKLLYLDYLTAEEVSGNINTRKGNVFHEFSEKYNPDSSIENQQLLLKSIKIKHDIDESYDFTKPIDLFKIFYEKEFLDKKDLITSIEREVSLDFETTGLDGKLKNFTAKIDVLVSMVDGSYIIYDYKTSKTAETRYHVDQMSLYMKAIQIIKKIPTEDVCSRVQVKLFFPFAAMESDTYLDVLKNIVITPEILEFHFSKYLEHIDTIEDLSKWTPEAKINPLCDYCMFSGTLYCKKSQERGFSAIRGIKIKKKTWS